MADLIMQKIFSAILFVTLLFSVAAAHAEGGCPPGQYPQQGQGWQTCVPIPGSQQPAQPTASWQSRSGAIATDGDKGVLGVANDERTRAEAERAALLDCKAKGGTNCQVQTYYTNGCGVMTVGSKGGFYTSTAQMKNDATQRSLHTCEANGDTGCYVYYSGCSAPTLQN